jgi:hypothetical protein
VNSISSSCFPFMLTAGYFCMQGDFCTEGRSLVLLYFVCWLWLS